MPVGVSIVLAVCLGRAYAKGNDSVNKPILEKIRQKFK